MGQGECRVAVASVPGPASVDREKTAEPGEAGQDRKSTASFAPDIMQIQAFVDFNKHHDGLLVVPPSMACEGCRGSGAQEPFVCVVLVAKGKKSCVGCGSKPCKFEHGFKDILLVGCKRQLLQLRATLSARAHRSTTTTASAQSDSEGEDDGYDEAAAALLPSVGKALRTFCQNHPDTPDH